MLNRQKKFRMERLEDRQMMAGDIAVSFSNGLLSITEARGHEGEDNTVAVSMEANGNLRVVGGGVDQQFNAADVENIDILLGRGSDNLVFQADLTEPGIPNYGTQVFINMGVADYGNIDQVEILNTDIEGLVQVVGGWADDTVYVHDTTILGDGLIVNTGSGSDVVAVVDCGDGDDQLLYDGIVADRLTAFGGDGTNDQLWTRFESERNRITTHGHAGFEHVNEPMRATLTHASLITKNTVTNKMVQTNKFVP